MITKAQITGERNEKVIENVHTRRDLRDQLWLLFTSIFGWRGFVNGKQAAAGWVLRFCSGLERR
jgi:hypothetical protein